MIMPARTPPEMPGRLLWTGRRTVEHEDGADVWAEALVELPASCSGFDLTAAAERWVRELASAAGVELAAVAVKGRGVEAEYIRGAVHVYDSPALAADVEARAAKASEAAQ